MNPKTINKVKDPNKNSVITYYPPQNNSVYKTVIKFVASLWRKCVENFKFWPIRLKLIFIIGSIVIFVVTVFSLLVLKSQEQALMQRMNQVCFILMKTLSKSAKDGLLLRRDDLVTEAVHLLNRYTVEGLNTIAIIDQKGNLVVAVDNKGQQAKLDSAKLISFLKYDEFTPVESPYEFEFYNPITQQIRENARQKEVILGVAYMSFTRDVIFAPNIKARKMAVIFAVIVTVFAIILINLIAKKMASQIKLLSDGARQITAGNLNIEISVNSKDELGQLASDFNDMTQHLREKLQMQKFVSKLTVQMIKDTVRDDNQSSKAVKKEVTVLFSDVRNFSSISEDLDPGEIVKLINVYFDIQTRVIESHKGVVDKFMGDQIMAIFVGEGMADNSLRAAVEIQRQVRLTNQNRQNQNKKTLEMGIGINNGSAVIGNMGATHRMDYTVIGDVVNVAARLCSMAKAGQIITSFEVAKKVNGSYPTSRLKSIVIKGRKQKIEVCEVDYDRDIIT